MLAFIHRHTICFEETNVVGNVYFARHVAWQGTCREMFLRCHAPSILKEIERDLRLVTIRVTCEYFQELRAFDEIELHMTLAHVHGNRIGLAFEYLRATNSETVRCAQGTQDIGCMRAGTNGELHACAIPDPLLEALEAFR